MGYGGLITLVSYQPQPKVIEAIVDETGELICPYQGLQAFTAEQQAFFFGRQRTVEEIRRRLEQQPFVPVIGASGSGKSSVVRAGLMPWLTETGWQILPPIKLGFDPLAALRAVFEPYFKRSKPEIQQLHQLIKSEPDPLPALVDRLSNATANSDPEKVDRFLLVVDQFEEVFTLCPDEDDRQRFIDLLTGVVELADARLAVVTTMRADFLEPCLRYPALHQLIQSQAAFMPPLTGVDLRDAIVEPAKRQGYSIEDGLLLKILEDVGKEPGFLPLLEFALTKLWEQRDTERRQLTLKQYENLGDMTGALNLHAENVYRYRDFEREVPTEKRSESEQEWIKRIFLRLVRTGEAEKDTRQRQAKTELLTLAETDLDAQNIIRELIEDDGGLVQGRLLVTGQEPAHSESWVDLAHEALLDGWTRFAEWRKGDREVRRLVDQIEDAQREWEQHGQNIDFLMPKKLIVLAKDQEIRLNAYLKVSLRRFYEQSKLHHQQLDVTLNWSKTEAFIDKNLPRVRDLLRSEPLKGLALAIQLVGLNLNSPKPLLSSVQNILHRAMELVCAERCLRECEGYWSVAFSPDSQLIVSNGVCAPLLSDLQGNKIGKPLQAYAEEWLLRIVAFSPDGQTIASGDERGAICIWNLQGELLNKFRGDESLFTSVVFSPDSKTILTSGRKIHLWNLQGKLKAQMYKRNASVAFSRDGKMIVIAADAIYLWNWRRDLLRQISQEQIFQENRRSNRDYTSVIFSPDGQAIASGSSDGTICLWDLNGNLIERPFNGHSAGEYNASVRSIAFSPDGRTIVSGGNDGTVRLWDLQGNPIGQPFEWHRACKEPVMSVAWSPDGETIASASDKTYLWSCKWQSWLQACCDYITHHSYFTNPQTEEAQSACEICRKQVWRRK